MKADYHIHSYHSGDSNTPMEQMILEGIRLGLDTMCFTEHQDYDYPDNGVSFLLNTAAYFEEFTLMQNKYKDQIELLFGVELGLQPHLKQQLQTYVKSYPFDFIIGSSHLVKGQDPYYPVFFEGRSEADCYMEYFSSIIENLQSFTDFSVYGHLDYIVRYGPNKNAHYSYEKYRCVIDNILSILIKKGIGLELNTAGFKYGLGHAHPHSEILKRYHQMGGEIITVGSDAHRPEHLAYDFSLVKEILKNCGFQYYAAFRNRKPQFIKL